MQRRNPPSTSDLRLHLPPSWRPLPARACWCVKLLCAQVLFQFSGHVHSALGMPLCPLKSCFTCRLRACLSMLASFALAFAAALTKPPAGLNEFSRLSGRAGSLSTIRRDAASALGRALADGLDLLEIEFRTICLLLAALPCSHVLVRHPCRRSWRPWP